MASTENLPTEYRPRRGNLEVRLSRYFATKGAGAEAAGALASASILHRHSREGVPIDRNAVEIIVSGVAAEGGRLWGPERWLGDLDMFREPSVKVMRPWTEFLCTTRTIRISREVLRSWAMRDLSVQRMLNQALVYQLRVHDIVYGLDSRSTTARLAQLIHYLAHQAPDLEEARLLPFSEGQLHGPTQKHLAIALGVSLASIEKSMQHLRKIGVLASSGMGRANRTYTILDSDLLYTVANGAMPMAS
ncbi:Crp/Fnr family transcriptional regulator [Streptomyces microflavus]|uniref:Crp/Fnr family transcriptional regulator n=1 Tax=Streptomyces microflavus TaxID=1919 RepID=A0A7H8MG35_STRMI|nr:MULTISPECIES: Crp/Fnr family transcriptional regulator [Streptomyces microflavus subgroup]QKW41073.1 Crp/Fnr family transcriptional regulator [Streptomyces microflavus]